MAKVRLDALLPSGASSSRVRGQRRRCWRERSGCPVGRPPASPASSCRRRRQARGRRRRRRTSRAAGIKLANALDAIGVDRRGPPRARRRRLDRRLHRLPAAARGRARRRLDVAYGELHWRLRNDPRVTVLERRNARDAARPTSFPTGPTSSSIDVSFISLAKVLPAVLAAAAPRYDCLALVKPQFEVGRERVGKGGVVRDPDVRREALVAVAEAARALARPSRASPPRACPAPRAIARPSSTWPRARAAASATWRPRRARSSRERGATVITHRRPQETADAMRVPHPRRPRRRRRAALLGRRDPQARPPAATASARRQLADDEVDLCVVLGGDGSILHRPAPLRRHRRARVRGELRRARLPGHDRARRRATTASAAPSPATSRCCAPGHRAWAPADEREAINDVSVHRRRASAWPSSPTRSATRRSAACPATASWWPRPPAPPATTSPTAARSWPGACDGFVVSFIAPALADRPRPRGRARRHAGRHQPVPRGAGHLATDGRPVDALAPGEALELRFIADQGHLAQLPGTTFYDRLRNKFGRLAF